MKSLSVYRHSAGRRIFVGIGAAVKFAAAIIMLCAVCALTFTVWRFVSRDTPASAVNTVRELPIIVIDAGHGGMDGGAVGADGTVEKEINLAVAGRLEALCKAAGVECIMTRSEDVMLVSDDIKTHRKMHDLKNRLSAVENITETGREAILVSIHMNNFSSPRYSGLQVWYSDNNEKSSQLAAYVQSYGQTFLDKDNKREIKRATSAIYILDRASVPAILIECGFLSNPEECQRLSDDEYQTELAVCIFSALCGWMFGGNL